MHHLLQKSLHCDKTLNYNTSLIEIHPILQYTQYYINMPPHYDILTLQFTPHWNTPYISIHLMLHCTPHNNTPQHYDKPYITLIGLHIMIHPYYTSIPPCYKAPNIAIHCAIQYIQHYNIKRGSLFNAELILKLKTRQQYVYYQNRTICFAKVIH